MNIVILNTEARLIELPAVATKVATGKEVVKDAVLDAEGVMVTPTKYMKIGTLIAEGHEPQQLSPGQNDVDDAYWEVIRHNKGVKILLAVGYLVNKGEGKAETLVADIETVDVSTAKRMITECSNIGVLTKWADSTDNRGLLVLIKERKAELISKADGRPAKPKLKDLDMGVFGTGTSGKAADGGGEASHGIGEQA